MRPGRLSGAVCRRLELAAPLRRAPAPGAPASLVHTAGIGDRPGPRGGNLIELGVTPTLIQPVVLCGGSGTRLWPLSREHHPTPLHALNGARTLLQETLARAAGVDGSMQPLVICNEAHRFLVAAQAAAIGARPKAIVLEPAGRGAAPAHRGYLVAFGVPPSSPEQGYGYIRVGGAMSEPEANFIEAFVEKPDAARAREYFESRDYLWNAGIFAVRASVWIDAIGNLRRDILTACERAYRQGRRDGAFVRVDTAAFESCPADSIDYAVMERIIASPAPPEAVVVRLDAQWTDVGAWDALWQIGEKDSRGNVVHGDVHLADTANALVVAQHRLVACVGLEDVVVVETPDAVMVARKDRAQAVGPLVSAL